MSRKKGRKMEDLTDVYNDLIMEHSMNSYNKRQLEKCDLCEKGHNPNCGDEITLEVKLDGNKIEDMAFTGHGCAISQASTSIMIDTLRGKTIEEAKAIIKTFIEMIKRETKNEEELEKLIYEVLNPIGYNLMVTPKEIDFVIDKLSLIIANSINKSINNVDKTN